MKHILIILLVASTVIKMHAQANSLDMGIFNTPVGSNNFEIRVKPTQNLTGTLSSGSFTVRFLSSYGVSIGLETSPPGLGFHIQTVDMANGYDYYAFSTVTNYPLFPSPWVMNQEYVVATFQRIGNGNGNGTFELITNDSWTNTHNANYYIELNGSDAQRLFYVQQVSAPLPVELTDFQAKLQPDRTVALDWQSESEVNLAYYSVEHSLDGLKFTEIGKVNGKGGLQHDATYHFIHTSPQAGKNYYRLRMVDHSATYQYSAIQTVDLEDKRNDFSLRPTPTTGPLTLMSQNLDQYPAGLQYQLTDNSGKLIQTDRIINEKTDFNLSRYSAGIYYLTVFTDQEQVKQFKVIVTKE
ncbi:MAG: T9SS type A sorting domain-containing protein [Saprospiraceae bacterium]